ncbi:hypothetical protein D9M68_148800 [compost metagenome]
MEARRPLSIRWASTRRFDSLTHVHGRAAKQYPPFGYARPLGAGRGGGAFGLAGGTWVRLSNLVDRCSGDLHRSPASRHHHRRLLSFFAQLGPLLSKHGSFSAVELRGRRGFGGQLRDGGEIKCEFEDRDDWDSMVASFARSGRRKGVFASNRSTDRNRSLASLREWGRKIGVSNHNGQRRHGIPGLTSQIKGARCSLKFSTLLGKRGCEYADHHTYFFCIDIWERQRAVVCAEGLGGYCLWGGETAGGAVVARGKN